MIPPVEIDFVARGLVDVGRAFDTIERRVQRFEQGATRTARRGTDERVRLADREESEKEKSYRKLQREIDRMEQQRLREAQRTERAITLETEREEERRLRLRMRSSEAAGKFAAKQAAEEMRERRRLESTVRSVGGRAIGNIVTGGALMAGAVGIGGGFMLADAMRQRAEAGKNAALLVNAVTTGAAPPPGATIQNILGQSTQISRETGMSVADVSAGALEYSRKAAGGDFSGIKANLGFFAKMANVTGADIRDIAAGAGTLQSQNKDLTAAQMQQLILDVYAQGKAGSMSMVDVAKQMGTLGSTRTSLQGDMAVNQRKLLAMGQIAAPGGSIEAAGTFVKDMVIEAGKHAKELSALGVKFDKSGKFDLDQMIEAVFTGTHGNITQIGKLLGGVRGSEPFREMAARFEKAGGGKAGVEAVTARNREVESATMSIGQLEAQNQQILSDPAKKFELAVTQIKDTLMTSMEPALTKFAEKMQAAAPEIEKIIEKGGELASWLAENPLRAAISLIGASIAKDVAAAAIGEAIKKESVKMLGGLSTATIAVAAASIMIAKEIDKDVAQQGAQQGESAAAVAQSASTIGQLRRGAISPEAAKKERARLAAIVERNREAVGSTSLTEAFFTPGISPLLNAIQGKGYVSDEKLAAQEKTLQLSQGALAEFDKALAKYVQNSAQTASNTAPGAPARNVPIPQRGVH